MRSKGPWLDPTIDAIKNPAMLLSNFDIVTNILSVEDSSLAFYDGDIVRFRLLHNNSSATTTLEIHR